MVRPHAMLTVLCLAFCAAVATALAGPLDPPAGPVEPTMRTLDDIESRTPIRQADLPLTIVASGSYYLAENLNANATGVVMVSVVGEDVSIDLNGFTVLGTSQVAQASDCILIDANVKSFALRNGTIRACGGNGLAADSGVSTQVIVERVQTLANGASGMWLGNGAQGVISECTSSGNAERGYLLTQGVIRGSFAYDNGTIGISVGSGLVHGCSAQANDLFNVLLPQGGSVADTFAP